MIKGKRWVVSIIIIIIITEKVVISELVLPWVSITLKLSSNLQENLVIHI